MALVLLYSMYSWKQTPSCISPAFLSGVIYQVELRTNYIVYNTKTYGDREENVHQKGSEILNTPLITFKCEFENIFELINFRFFFSKIACTQPLKHWT